MKGSTGITIVIAIGIACLVGGSLANDVNAYKSDDNATTPENDESKKTTNFILSVNSSKIWTRPYTEENAPSSETKITDSPDFASKFIKREYDVDLTSDCSNKRIYILKSSNDYLKSNKVLDVVEYGVNNKFERIKRIHDMFRKAISITCDWTTGKLYWLEYVADDVVYAIKVTNKFFDEPEYVVKPTEFPVISPGNIEVYPKTNEIFFLNGNDVWYTSNALNSTPHFLFPTREHGFVLRIRIDYALDKLCWDYIYGLNCIEISGTTRPIDEESIQRQDIDITHSRYTVLNNVRYISVSNGNDQRDIRMENGNKNELVALNLQYGYRGDFRVWFPSCSYELEISKAFLLSFDSFTLWRRPYFAEKTSFTEFKITDSPNFTRDEYEKDLTSDCSNKRIYILKTKTSANNYSDPDRVLDVIEYDKSNNFQRIQRVSDMFDGTVSIASDWTTGKLYWIEKIQDDTYAIKVTNKFFNESNYVIRPTKGYVMSSITVYPKTNELFFSSDQDIWYSSNLPNSTAHLLFSSSMRGNRPLNIVIDYARDKLCWETLVSLQCVDISDSTRPLNVIFIDAQPISKDHLGFTVFDDTYYWLVMENQRKVLYKKNDDKSQLVKSNVEANSNNVFFFSPNCPYEAAELTERDQWKKSTNFFVSKTPSKIFTRPYFEKENIPPTLVNISDSSDFSLKYPKDIYKHERLVSGCFNKTIYILKINRRDKYYTRVLDVVQHDGNNQFQRIKREHNMFNQTESISLDWTTGKLYWIDRKCEENKDVYSIKVTNELFKDTQYVIGPTKEMIMNQIQVYPKRKEIIFSNDADIWYSSTLPHSVPSLLFSSKLNVLRIFSLSIDYAVDKLCWDDYDKLYCIYIGGYSRPLNVKNIVSHPRPKDSLRFAVFNNTFYWLEDVMKKKVLHMRNDNNISKIEESNVKG